MRAIHTTGVALLWGLLMMPALAAEPATGAAKAEAERCTECHGRGGQGDGHGPGSTVRFPKLAGQQAAYLLQQLKDFRSGRRKSDVMRLNVQHLDDADLAELAAYYAGQPPMRPEARAAPQAERPPALYASACAACHGEAGVSQQAPRLAGQDAHYLARQLDDFRSGWRTSSLQGAMNSVAQPLSDAQIRSLADYLASLGTP